ncbi:MAG TPA: AMP-binding protein, partial [Geomonas sp.]
MSLQIDLTVGALLDDIAGRFPDNEALVYVERGLRYSYREFNERCRQVAKGLLALGVKKGDHLSIWAYNVPEWVVLQFATAKIGAVLVTVNTSYKSAELEYILNQSDSSTLFLVQQFKDTDYVRTLSEVVPELAASQPGKLASAVLPHLKNVVFLGEGAPGGMFNF